MIDIPVDDGQASGAPSRQDGDVPPSSARPPSAGKSGGVEFTDPGALADETKAQLDKVLQSDVRSRQDNDQTTRVELLTTGWIDWRHDALGEAEAKHCIRTGLWLVFVAVTTVPQLVFADCMARTLRHFSRSERHSKRNMPRA